jgi:hypothetical protein
MAAIWRCRAHAPDSTFEAKVRYARRFLKALAVTV